MTRRPGLDIPLVREASETDLSALASLMTELGYPVTEELLSMRIRKLQPPQGTFVAELDGAVVGFIGCSALHVYERDGPICWIMVLSVAERARRRGVASALVGEVEQWCRRLQIDDIAVHTGEQRTDAHAFYEACGFQQTGRRFRKTVREV